MRQRDTIESRRLRYQQYSPIGQVCKKCVMDDTDMDIWFDENGVCCHCNDAAVRLRTELYRGKESETLLNEHVSRIRAEGRGRQYDCIIGVSGGVDSTYVAWRCKQLGLRPLAVHLDNGWNSDLAVSNIEKTLEKLNIDLFTYVVNWEEMKDLQRCVILSSTANLEIVTDHAINAILFRQASRFGLRTIVTGNNVETESMHLGKWHYDNRDAIFIKGLHKRFGRVKLKTYPFLMPWHFLYYLFIKRIRTFPLLNYDKYNKEEVKRLLERELGWQPYAHKHGESTYTRFLQEYYLPRKFDFDKRKLHLSTLIAAGQMSRQDALQQLNEPLLTEDEANQSLEYVIKKLGFTQDEWKQIMAADKKYFFDYPNLAWMFDYNNPLVQFMREVGKSQRTVFGKPESKSN